MEKQKTNRVEAVVREQRAAMEKELGNMQAKAQGNFQELQNMQMKVRTFYMVPRLFFFSSCPGTLVSSVKSVKFKPFANIKTFNKLLKTASCCCCCVVSAGERAVGKPNYPTAAGERHLEGCSQLCHQPDGEQVSIMFYRRLPDVLISAYRIL